MPSNIESSRPFHPIRWTLIALALIVLAYAIGYTDGYDTRPAAPPSTASTAPTP